MKKLGEEVGRLADILSVSGEAIHRAMADCGMECTEHPGARAVLHMKLDHVLDRLHRIEERQEKSR
jgi:hypothetical protein